MTKIIKSKSLVKILFDKQYDAIAYSLKNNEIFQFNISINKYGNQYEYTAFSKQQKKPEYITSLVNIINFSLYKNNKYFMTINHIVEYKIRSLIKTCYIGKNDIYADFISAIDFHKCIKRDNLDLIFNLDENSKYYNLLDYVSVVNLLSTDNIVVIKKKDNRFIRVCKYAI